MQRRSPVEGEATAGLIYEKNYRVNNVIIYVAYIVIIKRSYDYSMDKL